MRKLLQPFTSAESSSAMLWVMLALLVLIGIIGPLLVIQALNTLFALSIPYNMSTWSSVVIIHMFLNLAVKLK
jgi:hypothetical protein